ncbi:hypothetical protein DPMN_181820 [Dreissena polymorpha]|uniref:EGF-like domain-containing protein n=1 Tax=Dreissena polymorpha TaxID=45954 RepID=A0A9D4DF81_DREPO|nr:hypothetical protein DPMN_181820 [Dreissena polymorpha]
MHCYMSYVSPFPHRCEGGASGENCENATKVCDVLSNIKVCTNTGNCTDKPGTAECKCPIGIVTKWKLYPCFILVTDVIQVLHFGETHVLVIPKYKQSLPIALFDGSCIK